jgi:hypothetical protein
VFGRDLRTEGGLGPDVVSPIWTRAAQNDPIIRSLLDNMIAVRHPSRFVTVDGQRRELAPEEYGRLQELSGRYIQEDLAELVSSAEWRDADRDERKRLVDRVAREARDDAKADLAIDAPALPPGFELAS